MNAREDHLSEYYGINIYDRLKKLGQSWVVAKSEIIYRKPAFLMEKVLIKSQVINYGLKHIEVEMSMYDSKGEKLKALLRSVFIPFDIRTNQRIEHDDVLMNLLKLVHIKDITPNMEERVAALEGKLSVS
jgi:acyl-CoA thioesterase FadM